MPEYGPRQYEVTYAPAVGVTSADRAVIVRELARAAARVLGHRISFSPAVTPDIVGNGVHVHMSLVDLSGWPVMYDADAPHGLSETGGRFVAGILHHATALCAVTAPSVISYLRLVPHRWSAAWSNAGFRDREACVRICPVVEAPGVPIAPQFNIEFRAADATASPYLALGALVYAGLDGILQKMPPRTSPRRTLSSTSRNEPGSAFIGCRSRWPKRWTPSRPTKRRRPGFLRRCTQPISPTSAAS